MKHILFPTVAAADAFVADLQAQNVVRSVSNGGMYRQGTAPAAVNTTTTTTDTVVDGGGTAEDAGAGAVKGTGVGALTGLAAGVLAAGATIATGGLALPVILGMTAAGAGVGAAVGGIGGAAGVDETGHHYAYESESTTYDRYSNSYNAGGRAVAVDDNVPADVLDAAVRKHGGEYVNA